MSLDITVTDLFCGAGGSSLGAEAAGARLRMAANHWRLAIETHNANFPHADHDCADVSQVQPRRYPSTDILIASPECTNHSQAKARKSYDTLWSPADPSQERSRATMWDVPRFAEAHRYAVVIVENVVEATRWEPFEAWLGAMRSLGYEHRLLFLNSMVAHPTPQSRDRMYGVFWRRGNPSPDLDIRPDCWCWGCERVVPGVQSWKRPERQRGKYRSQYLYRCGTCAGVAAPIAWPAASAIDWSLPTPRIGDRERPLAPATIERIHAGLRRYGPAAVVQAAGNTWDPGAYKRVWAPWDPLPTQMATIQHGVVVDASYAHAAHDGKVRPTALPLPTQTTQQSQALVVPLRTNGTALDPSTTPLRTQVAGNEGQAVVTFVTRHFRGGAEMSKPVTAPLGTVTTQDHHSLTVVPFTVDYHGNGASTPVVEPIPTQDTRDRHALVTPEVDVEDCGFRMLEPHEIQSAMAFPAGYEVRGNKRDRVRQLGNAVTPPIMSVILQRAIDSLAGGPS